MKNSELSILPCTACHSSFPGKDAAKPRLLNPPLLINQIRGSEANYLNSVQLFVIASFEFVG